MRKAVFVLAFVLAASAALAGTNLVRSHLTAGGQPPIAVNAAQLEAKLTALYGAAATTQNMYLGSEVCLGCHGSNGVLHGDADGWKNTRHSQMLRRPMGQYTLIDGKGVIANQAHQSKDDFMVGVDLATIGSFASYGANAPKLAYDAATDTYWMQIGALRCQVVATVAGSSDQDGQRYLLRVPVTDTDTKLSKALYFAPATYSRSQGWMPASGWYDANHNPKFDASVTSAMLVASGGPTSHTKNCVGCHSTGIRSLGTTPSGEATFQGYYAVLYDQNDPTYFDYNGDGNFLLMNIGCERCHGPGGQHVLGGGDTSKIVNPANLPGAQAAEICARCHEDNKSLPNKTYSWAYDDANGVDWIPAAGTWVPITTLGAPSFSTWPDGWLPKGGRPYDYWMKSAHAASHYGQNGSSVACNQCHDMHDKQQVAQVVTSLTEYGVTIPTSPDNDTLCLACHATHGPFANITKAQVADFAHNESAIADVVTAHTHHPWGPDRTMGLSRCTTCHMSPAGSHTFVVIEPEKTLKYQAQGGMPNACASACHGTLVNTSVPGSPTPGIDSAPGTWNQPFDTDLASTLLKYYGPNGLWWQHTIPTGQ